MRRYGDNISSEDILEEEIAELPQSARVLLGGCAVMYGSFPKPENRLRQGKPTGPARGGFLPRLLDFLGFKRINE